MDADVLEVNDDGVELGELLVFGVAGGGAYAVKTGDGDVGGGVDLRADVGAVVVAEDAVLRGEEGGELEASVEPPQSATALVGELSILLPMAGLIDAGAEAERLGKLLAKAQQDLTKTNAKMANENFVRPTLSDSWKINDFLTINNRFSFTHRDIDDRHHAKTVTLQDARGQRFHAEVAECACEQQQP